MERAAFIIYLLVLVISPLLFGAVHAYAYSLVFVLVLGASLLMIIHNIRKDYKRGSLYFQVPETGLNHLFWFILLFLFLQVIPLPGFLLALLSPLSLEVNSQAATLVGRQDVATLAPYIYPVRMSLLRWTVYGLFFIGLSQVLNSRKRIDILCFSILITASFISVYGIYQAYAGDHRVWWFSGFGQDVRGTYINRNHFAGLMAMALMLATGYGSSLTGFFTKPREGAPVNARLRMLRLLSLEQTYSKQILVIFCGVIIGLGLILSASRGGIISAALGLLLMGLFYVSRKSQRKNGFIVLALFLLIGGYGLRVGIEHTIERFQADQLQSSFEGRFRYAQKTVDVFRDYELTGVGVGNFRQAYPRYQAPEDLGLLIDYAHNDWAQLLAEAGVLGFILTLVGIGLFVVFIMKRWLTRRDPQALSLGLVPLAVLTTMGVHSWFDFNMHIPANVLMLGAVISAGQAALFIRTRQYGESFELGYRRLYWVFRGFFTAVLLLLLVGWSLSWSLRHFAAETYCNTVTNSTLLRDQNPDSTEINRAISWDRFNAEYWYKLGQATRRESTEEREHLDEMTEMFENALLLNPFSGIYYFTLGWTYTLRWQEEDYLSSWLPKADQAMKLAGLNSGKRDPKLHASIGRYWLMRSKTIGPASEDWGQALDNVGFHYKLALDLERGRGREKLLEDIRDTLWNYYPDADILERIGIKNGE